MTRPFNIELVKHMIYIFYFSKRMEVFSQGLELGCLRPPNIQRVGGRY